ncbi:MAG TPA: hypothetical protein VNZ52_14280 [Candidatus Thermoplasmatota archaeon]|nr:hypothetical protein [Candidatus Thermoplasmatota archaeon]
MAHASLDRLRRDLEQFGYELAKEEYANLVGLKADVDTSRIYRRYGNLHTMDTLGRVRACTPRDEDEARRLRYLEFDLLGTVIGNRFKEADDWLSTEETKAVCEVDGKKIPYRDIDTLIAEEANRPKRRRLRDAMVTVSRRFLPYNERLLLAGRAAMRDLGYPDEAECWTRQHGIDLEGMDRLMQRVLSVTAKSYSAAMDERLEEVVGVGLPQAEGHDVSFLMRARKFDRYFPKDKTVPALFGTLKGMGFRLDRMGNVTLDLEDRSNKDSRAFVMPAKVPHDVRLVTRPRGGVDDYRSLFHESGHALHFALTEESLPYEYRYHGDSGVTESYAFLFEHLLENPRFLAEVAPKLKGAALSDYLRFTALEKLLSLRYYAAALHYDRFLATHDLEDAQEKYPAWMTDALKYPANPLSYLSTDGFYGMWYLRAWLFEAMHRRYLEERFGETWWRDPGAGEHLKRFYRQGEKPKVEDLAAECGFKKLDIKPLMQDLQRLAEA